LSEARLDSVAVRTYLLRLGPFPCLPTGFERDQLAPNRVASIVRFLASTSAWALWTVKRA